MAGSPLDDVRYLAGVGPSRAGTLARLGILSISDLLLHIPRSYLDRRSIRSIGSLSPGVEATVSGEVTHVAERRTRGGRSMIHAYLSDGTGILDMVFFNAGYLRTRLTGGVRLTASGRVDFFRGPSMAHPELVFLDDDQRAALDSDRMTPVYPLTAGLSQGVMRGLVRNALEASAGRMDDLLPPEALAAFGFSSRLEVFGTIHAPTDPDSAERARRALALEELYLHQSYLAMIRAGSGSPAGLPLALDASAQREFEQRLPFEPTRAQSAAIRDIASDVSGESPMRRLLQGDVGSGKTAVAAFACWAACRCGMQAALLAPTEVLAAQHFRTLSSLLAPMGTAINLLTGGSTARERADALESAASGKPSVLIGTHAILEPPVSLPRLALLVVDEQHKFGVDQREALLAGRDRRPHLLVMSATPIPRTLAMAFYGDLDITVIDEMPPGRGRIHTRIVREEGRREAMDKLLERLAAGERAYVVYPLKEASEKQDLLDASTAFERMAAGPAGRYGVGLLHGAMSPAEKNATASDFAEGRLSVLVSTTVVEVGLDVPEATVMIVSGAGRFGLSQLHQLRGRIGRSGRESWCFLIAGRDASGKALERLSALASTSDGFALARKDLELRGPGDILGTRQSGLPEFRVADLVEDEDLLVEASALARAGAPGASAVEEMRRRFGAGASHVV
ncbi:MAG: ATP-dependent DNA helicase RecG [Candidatus Fermentibacter daniensis]|nr:ATP-dependent DNA helicase RecG [Candidatus Fermentibacter daniensis]